MPSVWRQWQKVREEVLEAEAIENFSFKIVIETAVLWMLSVTTEGVVPASTTKSGTMLHAQIRVLMAIKRYCTKISIVGRKEGAPHAR